MKNKLKSLGITLLLLLFFVQLVPLTVKAQATIAESTSLTVVTNAPTVSGIWKKASGGIRFLKADGKYAKSEWIKVNGNIYYINSSGYRTSGWIKYRGDYYYTLSTGRLYRGWGKTNSESTYYFLPNGKQARGFRDISGRRYYFSTANGKMVTGWAVINTYKYYFSKTNGQMLKQRWVQASKRWYYLTASGRTLKNTWLTIGDKKYYIGPNGYRFTGTHNIGDKWYWFSSEGVYDPNKKINMIDPNKPMVALTFDDGPGAYTMTLLNCLKANNAKATFFMVGLNVPNYPNAIKQMVAQGCELGNHSYSHPTMSSLGALGVQQEISKTDNLIYQACGKYPTLVRLPYGDGWSNPTVLGALGKPSIVWSLDTVDWQNTGNPQSTINAVLNNVRSGDIVLMHDIHSASVTAALTIIPALKARGYQMVTVSELAKYKGKQNLSAGVSYFNFR